MKKKKATPKSSPNQSPRHINASHHQRQRILEALRQAGSLGLTTIQMREQLDIMMPGARVYELRHGHGYNIYLSWDRERTAQGHEHTCGRYILLPSRLAGCVMNTSRERIQADIAAYLTDGGEVHQCDTTDNAGATSRCPRARQEALAHRKRLDGYAMGNAIARRLGGAQ